MNTFCRDLVMEVMQLRMMAESNFESVSQDQCFGIREFLDIIATRAAREPGVDQPLVPHSV